MQRTGGVMVEQRNLKMLAMEMGAMWPQGKDCPQPPEAGEGKDRILLNNQSPQRPANTLISVTLTLVGRLASTTVRIHFRNLEQFLLEKGPQRSPTLAFMNTVTLCCDYFPHAAEFDLSRSERCLEA